MLTYIVTVNIRVQANDPDQAMAAVSSTLMAADLTHNSPIRGYSIPPQALVPEPAWPPPC